MSAPGPDLVAVHRLAQELHEEAGPLLGVHTLCVTHALLVLAAARARGIDARLCRRAEDGHAWTEFPGGAISENWFRDVRLTMPAAVPAPASVR
jgi:hypothetical protein